MQTEPSPPSFFEWVGLEAAVNCKQSEANKLKYTFFKATRRVNHALLARPRSHSRGHIAKQAAINSSKCRWPNRCRCSIYTTLWCASTGWVVKSRQSSLGAPSRDGQPTALSDCSPHLCAHQNQNRLVFCVIRHFGLVEQK